MATSCVYVRCKRGLMTADEQEIEAIRMVSKRGRFHVDADEVLQQNDEAPRYQQHTFPQQALMLMSAHSSTPQSSHQTVAASRKRSAAVDIPCAPPQTAAAAQQEQSLDIPQHFAKQARRAVLDSVHHAQEQQPAAAAAAADPRHQLFTYDQVQFLIRQAVDAEKQRLQEEFRVELEQRLSAQSQCVDEAMTRLLSDATQRTIKSNTDADMSYFS